MYEMLFVDVAFMKRRDTCSSILSGKIPLSILRMIFTISMFNASSWLLLPLQRDHVIPSFVASVVAMPQTIRNLCGIVDLLHQHGINLRFLGLVYTLVGGLSTAKEKEVQDR